MLSGEVKVLLTRVIGLVVEGIVRPTWYPNAQCREAPTRVLCAQTHKTQTGSLQGSLLAPFPGERRNGMCLVLLKDLESHSG